MKLFLKKTWKGLKRLFIFLFVLQLLYIVALKWINPPFTATMVSSWITTLGTEKKFQKKWVNYNNISPHPKAAVIAGEDQLFAKHNGFSISAIKKAMEENKTRKKPRGASTISQQTAKNVFLWQGGGYFRKGLEVYFTFMIEKIWGKKRILEVYLNVAEMGDGIFGIEAASQHYFNVSAKQISKEQAALIAASLPNPKFYTIRPLANRTQFRQQFILRQMRLMTGAEGLKELLES